MFFTCPPDARWNSTARLTARAQDFVRRLLDDGRATSGP
jgi:hypothetical protein